MGGSGEQAVQRGSWSVGIQFFITSLGAAVGLGNIWRFPSVVYSNGGAVFLIAYVLALIFLAIPILMLESAIGQYSKKSPIGIWDMSPIMRGVGYATFVSAFINMAYYNTPLSWGAYYMISAMSSVLPWSECNPEWATSTCTTNMTLFLSENSNATGPAEEFFYHNALKLSSDALDWGTFSWQVYLCSAVLWLVLFGIVCFGAQSMGAVAYFTSLFPYVMITIMIGYTATLPGAADGVAFYMTVQDWSRLADIKLWRSAVGQVFYSTNCALGPVIQLSSYNKFNHNIYRDAILIPIMDGLTSIFAGFSVFTVLGYMATVRNLPIDKVVEGGPGLIFITYAELFTTIEGGNVWAVFFFFMVIILGLSSQFPSIEMCCSAIAESYPFFNKTRLRNLSLRFGFISFCFAVATFFFCGNGYYWYYLIDERVTGIPLIIIGFFELIGIGWFYNGPRAQTLLKNISEMVGGHWGPIRRKVFEISKWYWLACWLFIAPATIAFIFIYDVISMGPLSLFGYVYPDWALGFAWALVAISPALILIVAVQVACWKYKAYKSWVKGTKPLRSWGPARDEEPHQAEQPHSGKQEEAIAMALAQPPPYWSPPPPSMPMATAPAPQYYAGVASPAPYVLSAGEDAV